MIFWIIFSFFLLLGIWQSFMNGTHSRLVGGVSIWIAIIMVVVKIVIAIF